jgi:hypothetical protein
MIERAKAKLPDELSGRLEFVVGDAERLPFAEGSLDLVAQISVAAATTASCSRSGRPTLRCPANQLPSWAPGSDPNSDGVINGWVEARYVETVWTTDRPCTAGWCGEHHYEPDGTNVVVDHYSRA